MHGLAGVVIQVHDGGVGVVVGLAVDDMTEGDGLVAKVESGRLQSVAGERAVGGREKGNEGSHIRNRPTGKRQRVKIWLGDNHVHFLVATHGSVDGAIEGDAEMDKGAEAAADGTAVETAVVKRPHLPRGGLHRRVDVGREKLRVGLQVDDKVAE
jgi:hypothetical protein